MGIGENTVMIVDVAMLIPRKQPMDALKAFKRLSDAGLDVALYFLGNGEMRQEMESFISEHQLLNVHLTGILPLGEVAKYLAAADIYLMASEHDASPKALNEAMNFALPIVVSDGVETLDLLLAEGENGYSFPVGNVDVLASALERVIRYEHRREMGEASARIVARYDFERVADSWMQAVEYAVEKGSIKAS